MSTPEVIWSVSDVNSAVRELIENSLMPFWLRGEVGTLNVYSSGHVYLTLKDRECQIKCTFFRGAETARRMGLAVGSAVEAYGKLSVYPQRGEYQFNIKSLRIAGVGTLQQQFEDIKNKLAAEGLFDTERKLPLPAFPRTVGVITSPDGAAVRDFVNIARRRAPYLNIKIYPAVVQGNGCAESVMRGLEFFQRPGNEPDVLVITRGGGSMEDLWGFNSEALARAIAASRIPVVNAVGHEIDFTIADFAASLRAPTPSAAAELIAPEMAAVRENIDQYFNRMQRAWEYCYLQKLRWVELCSSSKVFHEPEYILRNYTQKVDDLAADLERAWRNQCELLEKRLLLAQTKLAGFDPQAVLQRGYAMLIKNDSRVADSVSKVASGEKLTARLADGTVQITVD